MPDRLPKAWPKRCRAHSIRIQTLSNPLPVHIQNVFNSYPERIQNVSRLPRTNKDRMPDVYRTALYI